MSIAATMVSRIRTEREALSFTDAATAHLSAVHRYLTQMVRDSHLAEDLTAETFERAFTHWHQFDPRKGSALTWLITIGRRIALDHLRSDARRTNREQRAAMMEPQSTPEPRIEGLTPQMAAALERLSAVEREVVALRVLLDVDGPTTARMLDITPTACSTHLHRAMTKLRKDLAQ